MCIRLELIKEWKEKFATNPDEKLPTHQKIEEEEEEEEEKKKEKKKKKKFGGIYHSTLMVRLPAWTLCINDVIKISRNF